jgi:hypothetical protein
VTGSPPQRSGDDASHCQRHDCTATHRIPAQHTRRRERWIAMQSTATVSAVCTHTQSRAQHATAHRGDTPRHGAIADGAVGHRHTYTAH